MPSILLLKNGSGPGDGVAGILIGVGHTVDEVATTADVRAGSDGHVLVIVDAAGDAIAAADACRELRTAEEMARLPIMCISPTDDVEARITLLEAGADDVLARPFDRRELEARVEALLLRFERNPASIMGSGDVLDGDRRRTIAVFSAKGGTGATTIAVNLAMAAAKRSSDVVIVDFDLQFGQVATHLNVEASQTLVDVVRDSSALAEPEILRTYAVRHADGVHVLAAPPSPQYAELIRPNHVEAILDTALRSWDVVVVDAGSRLDEHSLAVFEAADTVIVPVYAEIACLKAVHSLMEYLAETGSIGAKTLFLLNNLFAREVLRRRDIETALGTKLALDLPYDPFVYLKAVNEGVPVVAGAPRSAPAERFLKLASIVFGEASATTEAEPEGRVGFLGRLRRA